PVLRDAREQRSTECALLTDPRRRRPRQHRRGIPVSRCCRAWRDGGDAAVPPPTGYNLFWKELNVPVVFVTRAVSGILPNDSVTISWTAVGVPVDRKSVVEGASRRRV